MLLRQIEDDVMVKKKSKWDQFKALAFELIRKKTEDEQRDSVSVRSRKAFAIELPIFTALLYLYFFLVLSFLSNWLKNLFDQNKLIYALVALALIAGQGGFLEVIIVAVRRAVKSKIK
jgi:uncharacterized membrane protein (DUF485 family)